MEPLDPKAELMRLARECGDIERRACIGKAQGFDVRDAYAVLESAITLALAAERRRALAEAAEICETKKETAFAVQSDPGEDHQLSNVMLRMMGAYALDCAGSIRKLIDGKAGGT